jgi:hypothetical protein
VSYPASQNGGSVSYSGTAYENVSVNIDVDTNPFDRSIDGCNDTINLLTGTVVATEAAQIASIDNNAKKVANTIVDGFFKTIRSDISQQIMELSSKLDATLVHLYALAKRCVEKQKQMETDYNRIASRYLKIFSDLNNELGNRIFELNKPAFVFKKGSDNQDIRTSGNDLVTTVAVFGSEGGELQAKISASIAKKRALDTINKANIFLLKQKKLNATINQSMLNENIDATLYSPICFMETNNEKGQTGKNIYKQALLPETNQNEIIEEFHNQQWSEILKERQDKIQRYFNAEVSNYFNAEDTYAKRLKENIIKMFNFNYIQSVNQKN